jgi:hypothetical protein
MPADDAADTIAELPQRRRRPVLDQLPPLLRAKVQGLLGIKHSLHRKFRDARKFYVSYTALVVPAAAVVMIPGAPLGLITTSAQAPAGLLLPSASVFLLLLCN